VLRRKKRVRSIGYKHIQISEQVRIIRNNIENQMKKGEPSFLMITSPKEAFYQMYTSTHLAIAFVEQGKRVLLVDADVRKPTLHTYFNIPNFSGFSEVVLNEDDVSVHCRDDFMNGLSLLTAGTHPSAEGDFWVTKKINSAMRNWKEYYDLVLFHAPSYLELSDAQVLLEQCDGVLLVVQSGKTKLEDAAAVKQQINRSNKPIYGVIYQTG
jgi:protein-tyrosine kinase